MTMLIIEPHMHDRYRDMIEESQRVRHEVFVTELGWHEFDNGHGLEVDQFDNEDTIYFMKLNKARVIGGFRMHPTTKDTLVNSVFRHYCDFTAPPCGESIYDWTRLFVKKQYRKSAKCGETTISRLNGELYLALVEYCVNHSITHIISLSHHRWLDCWEQLGWQYEALGEPRFLDGGATSTWTVPITHETLATMRQRLNIPMQIGIYADNHGANLQA